MRPLWPWNAGFCCNLRIREFSSCEVDLLDAAATRQVAAEIAGTGYGAFLDALRERRISGYTSAMLREDIESLNRLFPDPLPLPAV